MFAGILNLITLGLTLGLSPAPVRYRIDIQFTQVADYTPLGQPVQESRAAVTGFLTLIERDTLGGKQAQFTLDSMVIAPGALVPPELLPADPMTARGITFTSMIAKGRSVGGFKLSKAQPHANLFPGPLDAIYPGFRSNAKIGDKWSDTVVIVDTLPIKKESRSVLSWTASGLLQDQLVLDGVVTGTINSTQQSGNGAIISHSMVTGTRQLTGTLGGITTSGTVTSNQEISATIGDRTPIVVKVEHRVRIVRLP